jgi:hypothetical protein
MRAGAAVSDDAVSRGKVGVSAHRRPTCVAVNRDGYPCELEPDHHGDLHRALIGATDEEGAIPEVQWREISPQTQSDELREHAEQLYRIGRQFANIAYNLKQGATWSDRELEIIGQLQVEWDASARDYRAHTGWLRVLQQREQQGEITRQHCGDVAND